MTLVVDASAVAELLLGTPRSEGVRRALGAHALIAPHHLSAEVVSVVRGWTLGGHISEERALTALEEFEQLGIEQHDLTGRLADVFALRHNLSAYDAMYVVLARAARCQLLTLDVRLAAAAAECALVPTAGS